MSYRVITVGTLTSTGGWFGCGTLEYKVMYEPKRAVSVSYSSPAILTHITYGYTLACF